MQSINGSRTLNGAVVFFHVAADTHREQLAVAWEAAGFKDFIPAERTGVAALKSALESAYNDRRHIVRKLGEEAGAGWAVVEEHFNAEGLPEHRIVLVGTVADKDHGQALTLTGRDSAQPGDGLPNEIDPAVRGLYQAELGKLPNVQVAKALVDVLKELKAISLRDAGGVYWLPENAVARFELAAGGVERAAVANSGASKVYFLRTAKDEAAARAIIDALTREVEQEVTRINEELTEGEIGKRACQTRVLLAQNLQAKIAGYEKALGVGLDGLKKAAEATEAAAAAAALEGIADQFAPVSSYPVLTP